MQELRFVAVSEDGSYAVLAVPGRSGRYILPIDERLRAVALGQTSRLAQYEIEVESPLRPKEIQARIRAGETAEEIADAAGIPVERVRWFEGPVLAERAYIADQAQSGSVRRAGDSSGPGPRLGEIVAERLTAAGTDPEDGQWDSRKRGDGNWQVSLTFPSGGRLHVAEWVFDPRRRHVMPDDDNAARLSLPESDLPAEAVPVPGEATVTPIASRLGAAAGMAGGAGASRFRPDRSVIPDRSLGADRSLAERPASVPGPAGLGGAAGLSDRASAPAAPAPAAPRTGQQDRPSQADRPAHPGYAEFPESAPYRAPEPAPAASPDPSAGQRTHRDPVGFRAQDLQPPVHRAPADEVPALDETERAGVPLSRPVVFEDPGPALGGERLEQAPATFPGPAGPPAAARAPAPAEPPETGTVMPSAEPAPEPAPEPAEVAEPAAQAPGSPAPQPEAEVAATAAPAAVAEQSARSRPGKKNQKGRRSSVPSWDEIMLGSSRQQD